MKCKTYKNNSNSIDFNSNQFFIVNKKSLPKILVDVLLTKEMIASKKMSIKDATNYTGISRTSYYKYYNDIFRIDSINNLDLFTIDILTKDNVGLLSSITKTISKNFFNILTINQHEPINNNTKITISLASTNKNCDFTKLLNELNSIKYVNKVNLVSINNN